MEDFITEFGIEFGIGLLVMGFVAVALYFGQRAMGKMSAQWEEVAHAHGLRLVSNPTNIDYDEYGGMKTFQLPGMEGQYRGRAVQLKTTIPTDGKDKNRYSVDVSAEIRLTDNVIALAHKRPFPNDIKQRADKVNVSNQAIKKQFTVRSDSPEFADRALQGVDIGRYKDAKLANGLITLSVDRVRLQGRLKRNIKGEGAISLIELICDFADAYERV